MKKFNIIKGPFIKSSDSTKRIMKHLLISLLPIILFSFYRLGILPYINGKTNIFGMFYPLIFILIGTITSMITEFIYTKITNKDFSESYSIFPGLFLSLVLPINTPILVLIIGSILAILLGKAIYGGFGKNVFNPALIGVLLVITLYGSYISQCGGYLTQYDVDVISSATPRTNLKLVDNITYENVVEPYGSINNFFIGTIPGAIGETSALLCLLAFIYLVIFKIIKKEIPIFYIGTVFIMSLIVSLLNGYGIWYPFFEILSGGLFFGAVFMATDPVTSPVTKLGKIMYGILLGILTFSFRHSGQVEAVMLSILIMNMFVYIIDKIGIRNESIKNKTIIISIILILLVIFLPFKFIEKKETDPNFNIISKENINDSTVYTVTERGNGGLIKIEITLKEGIAISYKVLENNETEAYYNKVISEGFIDKLLQNQNDLNNVDTVSGATISSTALKKALINVLEEQQ